jgi:hypothetical protein
MNICHLGSIVYTCHIRCILFVLFLSSDLLLQTSPPQGWPTPLDKHLALKDQVSRPRLHALLSTKYHHLSNVSHHNPCIIPKQHSFQQRLSHST